jgi:hypothetical protein
MELSLLLLLLNVAAAVIPIVSRALENSRTTKQNEAETLVKGAIDPLWPPGRLP